MNMSRKKNINSEMRGTDSRHFQPKQHEKRHFYTATLSQTNYCEFVEIIRFSLYSVKIQRFSG